MPAERTLESLFLRIPPGLKLAIGAAASLDDKSLNDLCAIILTTYVANRCASDEDYAQLLWRVGVNNQCPEP